jgi:cytochrome c biogenesis protein CcmG, thiol:disulfide interchange protein DsbE
LAEVSAGELKGSAATPAPWRGRRWLLIAVVAGVAALLGLLLWGVLRGPNAAVGGAVPLDKPAPDFTVTTIDGRSLRLSELRGKTVVVNVWASWCVPCEEEAGELNRSYDTYKGRDVVFVGIAWNDDDPQVRKFAERHKIAYPIALDQEGRIAIDLGITGVPETFLINAEGRLVQKWVGPITARQLNGLLAPMVP